MQTNSLAADAADGPSSAPSRSVVGLIPSDSFEAVFDAVFRDRFASLFSYLSRLSGDHDLASDLAQDAFLQLYRRGSLPVDPGAWLVTVAHNRLRDSRRSVRRRLHLISQFGSEAEPSRDVGAIRMVEGQETGQRVRRVLSRLPDRDQQILLLHHGGYSYREIAVALSVAPSGVGTLLRRAGSAFRNAYQETFGASER